MTIRQQELYAATREEVFAAIDSEREYQQRVWAGADGEIDNPLTPGEFLTLLRVYLRKAEEAWVIEEKPEVNTLDAVRKIAGIAVNCMEQHGAPHR
jgi:hypothetical protein